MGVQGGLNMEDIIKTLSEIICNILDWINLVSKKNEIFEKSLKRIGIICLCNTAAIIGLLIAIIVLHL